MAKALANGWRRNRLRGTLQAIVLGATLGVGACMPGGNLPLLPDAELHPYQLGAGDQVRIITFGEEQLSGDFRVDDAGTIDLPLLGRVAAARLTPTQLSNRISESLVQRKLFRSPSVSVEVTEYRPIFILGEVSKPGQYPFRPGMTVLSAVSLAGGFTYRGVQDRASIIRTEDKTSMEGRASRQTFIEPGDVITIFERVF